MRFRATSIFIMLASCLAQNVSVVATVHAQQPETPGEQTGAATAKSGIADGKASPALTELEDVVSQMAGILEVACVGVPDPKSGEAVKLVIVKKDPSVTEEDIRAYCKENLTGYKQPKVIEFRSELPKTPVGKILRRELRTK